MARLSASQTRHAALLAEGRAALLAGDKEHAQRLLQAAIEHDPQSEEAWMWLSGAQSSPAEMRACLERVLAINPANEQAHEGLRWIEAEYGPPPAAEAPARPPDIAATNDTPLAEPIMLHPRRPIERSAGLLLETLLHPFAVGALLGLLRVLGWLRPQTLVLLRSGGALGFGGGAAVAVTAVLLHGFALVAVTLGLGWRLNRVRTLGRGDRFDSLLRAARIWIPGYTLLGALVLIALGLPQSAGPWRVVAIVCWLVIGGSGALVARRLWHTLSAIGVTNQARPMAAARILVFVLLTGLIGLGLAGLLTAAVLR